MAMVSVPKVTWSWPTLGEPLTNNSTSIIDAPGEKEALQIYYNHDVTIAGVIFGFNALTTGDLRVSVQPTSSGVPSGTPLDPNLDTILTVTTTGQQWYEVTFPGTAVLPAKTPAAVVIEVPATNGATGYVYVNNSTNIDYPWAAQYTTGWNKNRSALVGVRLADGTLLAAHDGLLYRPGGYNTLYWGTTDEKGLLFSLPVGVRLVGCSAVIDADDPCELRVYDDTGTLLTIHTCISGSDRRYKGLGSSLYYFDTPVIIQANAPTRIVLAPTSGSVRMYTKDKSGMGLLKSLFIPLDGWAWTERSSGGPWSENPDLLPEIRPIIDQIDVGGSGDTLQGLPFARVFGGM